MYSGDGFHVLLHSGHSSMHISNTPLLTSNLSSPRPLSEKASSVKDHKIYEFCWKQVKKEGKQVNGEEGCIGIVQLAQILVYVAMCACAIAVQHEQWMCLEMKRYTYITLSNLKIFFLSLDNAHLHRLYRK